MESFSSILNTVLHSVSGKGTEKVFVRKGGNEELSIVVAKEFVSSRWP